MILAFSIIVVYNISQIISESTFPLFRFLRNLEGNWFFNFVSELTSCFLCTSVWAGLLVSWLVFDVASSLQVNHFTIFWSALFYSGCAWFLRCLEAKLG